MAAFRFCLLEPIKTPLVNKFYDKHNARGRASKADQVWVVYKETEIIAACRVQDQSGQLFLSTLYVDEIWRGQKVASQLLATVTAAQKGTVFTFVYQNLIDFYLQNGFNYALTLPNSLQSLFEVYAHRNVVAMHFTRDTVPS
ncbi:GNAT family N-acetyltransferase [Pseudoalteromonas shioyasakiensis]|uniref:GNAT family N-acetyltransferase n=1 Tax=Pseudoalteromonas shioyasakiensis TaxID=1190813 RepID=UPI001C3C2A9B|nr:GNAT family N-acetyltransferase [Pseudoalteromonas shioyasakiensis]